MVGSAVPDSAAAFRESESSPTRTPRSVLTYSRFVSRAKLFLPITASILIMVLSIWPYISAGLGEWAASFPKLSLTQIRDLRMVNPRYSGRDKQGHPFTLTADAARENGRDAGLNASLVALEGPKADMLTREGTWVIVSGDTGVYQSQTHMLDLFSNVTMLHDRNYRLTTASARVDLDSGNAEGHDHISGDGPSGTIEAEGFKAVDNRQHNLIYGQIEAGDELGA